MLTQLSKGRLSLLRVLLLIVDLSSHAISENLATLGFLKF